jgi:hypothetical protein
MPFLRYGCGWVPSLRFALDARPCGCGRHSHLPNAPILFTQPHRLLRNRLPNDARLSPGRWRDALFEDPLSTFQACSCGPPQGWLGGFHLRAWTSTAYLKIRLVPCARSASKGSCLADPSTLLRSQATTGPCGLSNVGAGGDHPHPVPFLRARSASKGDRQLSCPSYPATQPYSRWLGSGPSSK